ncbi:hypothetical protein CGSMWGv0288E_00435 [Gardnerella vaginalis 0288E]|nr:hypothetical protein CGSMWGv0288E_00435 [Gardnerella vaginalis 0288E]
MSYALFGPIIDILIALAICALVFFIARSLIRYAHSLKRTISHLSSLQKIKELRYRTYKTQKPSYRGSFC